MSCRERRGGFQWEGMGFQELLKERVCVAPGRGAPLQEEALPILAASHQSSGQRHQGHSQS